jgi:threonylcarbamoyladenosine tRNA methylthiotransferase MtaB
LADGPFAYAHVFKFSGRGGTAAQRLPDQVGPREKDRRSALIRWIVGRKHGDFHAGFAGSTREVLFECEANGVWTGHTENYIRVAVRSDDILDNELRQVILGDSCGDFVTGAIHCDERIEAGA